MLDVLSKQLNSMLSQLKGDVALKINFLNSNDEFSHNAGTQFWAASILKIPIACTFYKQVEQGKLSLSKRVSITKENNVQGSGIVKLLDSDTQLTNRELLALMFAVSDNSAANQLIDQIGWESGEAYMRELGLDKTTFRHKMMVPAGRGPNLTTAEDMAKLLQMLYENKLPGSHEILQMMQEQLDRTKIPLYIPNDVKIAHKYGSLPEAVHEVGIVYSENPFIFCFFSDDQKDKVLTTAVLAQCARLCFEHAERLR